MAHIRVENLSFTYKGSQRKALDDVSFEVEPGSLVLICGRNGSGKTTLLRNMKSMIVPEGTVSGRVLYDDVPLSEISPLEQAKKIGFVSQNPLNQLVSDKVWHEIAFAPESIGVANSQIRSRVAEMASFYSIQDWFDEMTMNLSFGQKQLLELASVAVLGSDVYVLDSPASQLDPFKTTEFLTILRKTHLELGMTVVISSQRLEDIFRFVDKAIVLDDGKIIAQGTPQEVGHMLYEENSEMKYALPTPFRVYHGLRPKADPKTYPVTIPEFRIWLGEEIAKNGLKVDHLPDRRASNVNKIRALELESISYRYESDGKDVLKDLSLYVTRGSLHALVGENGTGKTTALKIACGAIRNYRGKVLLYGHRINRMRNSNLYQTGIGMLPQELFEIFSKPTVKEELSEMLAFKKLPADELDLEVMSVAHNMGLLGIIDRDPSTLSFGEQQLVAIAKMLMRDLKVLLLDEPTKCLDALSRRRLGRVLHELTDRGVTVIMASHDLEFVAKYATKVSMFFDGSVITTETPQKFFSSNTFYTTAASCMSRAYFENAVTDEEVFILCQENGL